MRDFAFSKRSELLKTYPTIAASSSLKALITRLTDDD
jgi:hypothetical protein